MHVTLPGFADPVADAQVAFRAVLSALSRPGSIHRVAGGLTPPSPLNEAAAAVLLALVDGDICLFSSFPSARDWVRFHCGSNPISDPAAAGFVLADALPDLATLEHGSDEAPENSATVILQIPSLTHGPARTLQGPGLQASATIRAAGLPLDFAVRWAANHALFPRGIDLILCAGDQLLALPRSVTVKEG